MWEENGNLLCCFMPYNLKLLKHIETGCEYELNHYIWSILKKNNIIDNQGSRKITSLMWNKF